MARLFNPTDKDVYVVYNAKKYEVKAGAVSDELTEEVAHFWKKVHGFLEDVEVTQEVQEEDELVEKKTKSKK